MNLLPHYHDFLSRLRGRRGDGPHWEAFCPSCEATSGRSRSLSVTLASDGKLLVKCHSPESCSAERITASLGMSLCTLFPEEERRSERDRKLHFVCAYDYRDAEGEVLFHVVRWKQEDGSKTFSQRRPNPAFDRTREPGPDNLKWLRGVEGVELVLYRLPEMLRSLQERPGRFVFVIEGEKAVDYCRDQGLVATCNPMGAGKWRPAYARWLAGRNVIVVPDEDPGDHPPGLAHANSVCLSLYGLASSVRLLRLPEAQLKWGLDDWLKARNGTALRELQSLAESCQEWSPFGAAVPAIVQQLYAASVRRADEVPDAPTGIVDRWACWGEIEERLGELRAAAPGADFRSAALALAATLMHFARRNS